MASVTVSVPLNSQSFPAGTIPGAIRFQMRNSGNTLVGTVNVTPPAGAVEAVATFNSIAPGSYTCTIQALTSLNVPLGEAVVVSVSVAEPPPVVTPVPGTPASVVVA